MISLKCESNVTNMLMCLRVLLLVAKLSLVLSTVVVIKITEDDEQEKQIAVIEVKLDSQDEELRQLGNDSQAQNDTINFLSNLTQELQEKFEKHQDDFQNTNVSHQEQLNHLTKKIKEMLIHDIKFELQVKEYQENLNKTFQTAYKHQQEQIENLTKQNKELKGDIQKIHKVPLKNNDILGFDLAATRGWLGCPYPPCDLRKCPTHRNHLSIASKLRWCDGEVFQIFGNDDEYIRSGYKVRIRFVRAGSKWLSCYNGSCTVKDCLGSTTKATNFTIPCSNETFTIYGMARKYGDVIYNEDFVMLYNVNVKKYISIQGHKEGDNASLDYCPGNVPPYYFSYNTCTRNVFQTYKLS